MNRNLIVLMIAAAWLCWRCTPENTQQEVEPPQPRTIYELRIYHLENEAQTDAVHAHLANAVLPALERQGIGPVGVFTEYDSVPVKRIYMLIPYSSPVDFANAGERLMSDDAYRRAAQGYLEAAPEEAPYQRVESSILLAFKDMPETSVPPYTTEGKARIFELRSYESYNEEKGRMKVHMFNEGGEIGIFERLGFYPVFFGQALSGTQQPNLVYMTSFPNMEVRDSLWQTFVDDSVWLSIRDLPEYENTVSHIDITFLEPTDYSEI
jgi:hypothetical protein